MLNVVAVVVMVKVGLSLLALALLESITNYIRCCTVTTLNWIFFFSKIIRFDFPRLNRLFCCYEINGCGPRKR